MGFITVNIINDGNTLTRPKCTDDYGDILDEILGIIAAFERKKHIDFNDEWKQIITYIEEGHEKLKKCYDERLLDLKLDDDDDIKKFYTKCKSNAECLSYISPKLEKAAALLKDATETSCEGGGDCVEKVKAVKGEAGEGTSHPNEKDSGMQDLKTQKSRGQSGSPADGKEPRQQVISQVQQDVKFQETSVEPKPEELEAKVSHHFSPPEPIDNRSQGLGITPQQAHNTLDNSHNSQTPNDNAHGSQGVDSQTDKTHPSVDRDVSMVSTTESRATGTSISGEHGDVVSPHTVADRADNYRTSVTPVGSANVRGSSVASADTLHGVNGINRGATTSERVVTKAADSVPVSSERSGSSIPAVGSDQRKVDNLENHGSHEDAGRA
ncbi:variable surface protein Vir18, putative, partial [Plasmodium vivax]